MATQANGVPPPFLAEADVLLSRGCDLMSSILAFRETATTATAEPAAARTRVVQAAHAVLAASVADHDLVRDYTIAIGELTALRTLVDWDALEKIPAEGDITYKDWAAQLDAPEVLVTRLARMLVSTGFLAQPSPDRVAHTRLSKQFHNDNPFTALMQIIFDLTMRSWSRLPEWFSTNGRIEPMQQLGCPVTFAYGQTDRTNFEVINSDPRRMQTFMKSMATSEAWKPITGVYDFGWVAEYAQSGEDSARPLLVDVGGGKGQALKAILKEFPGIPSGRAVLQDLPGVMEIVGKSNDEKLKDVKLVGLDFLKEQPTKGGLVYFIRRCLHDWGDDDVVTILSQTAAAMAPDSRFLIIEQIMDAATPSRLNTYTDMMMMNIAGKERSLEEFRVLAARAGLEVRSVSMLEGHETGTGAVELVLPGVKEVEKQDVGEHVVPVESTEATETVPLDAPVKDDAPVTTEQATEEPTPATIAPTPDTTAGTTEPEQPKPDAAAPEPETEVPSASEPNNEPTTAAESPAPTTEVITEKENAITPEKEEVAPEKEDAVAKTEEPSPPIAVPTAVKVDA